MFKPWFGCGLPEAQVHRPLLSAACRNLSGVQEKVRASDELALSRGLENDIGLSPAVISGLAKDRENQPVDVVVMVRDLKPCYDYEYDL